MKLVNLANTLWSDWLSQGCNTPRFRRFSLVTSGYESRSSHWCRTVLSEGVHLQTLGLKALGFTDRKDQGSRRANDEYYGSLNIKVEEFSGFDQTAVVSFVRRLLLNQIGKDPRSTIQLNIDYSSMPRSWYCGLFQLAIGLLRPQDRLHMWYCGGLYTDTQFPTAGVSDFGLFSGRPTINPIVRTHVCGLGFDRIRASAIYRVLDPQNLVCFLGGMNPEYIQRVRDDNRDLLAAARMVFTAPVGDFSDAFSRIVEIAREYSNEGDVILVPDGPKPLVLASSLVPGFLGGRTGIVCLHVRRRKHPDAEPIDVGASGIIFGFSVSGENVSH